MMLLIRLIVLTLLLLTAAACADQPSQVQAEPTTTPIPTVPAAAPPTYLVQRGDVQEVLEFSGRWLPRDQLQLSFEISGTVRRVNVQRGDTVSAGQLLADYQITDLESRQQTAQLSLETALANLQSGEEGDVQTVADAQITLANTRLRLDNLRASSPWTQLETAKVNLNAAEQDVINAQRTYDDAVSRADEPNAATAVDQTYQQLQDAKNQVKTAEANYFSAAQNFNSHQYDVQQQENAVIQAELALERAQTGGGNASGVQAVRSAQLEVDQIKADIARSSLYAPIEGEVLEVTIAPGDAVQAYTAVITIGRSEPKEAVASLSFNDAQRMNVGLVGVCQIINRPDTAVQCIVRRLPLSAQDADQTARVAASFDNVPSGQLIEIKMPLQVRQNVLWLPPAAVRTFQNRTFVVLQTPDGPRRADVQIGLQTNDRVEIISGVNEGDVVIGQ